MFGVGLFGRKNGNRRAREHWFSTFALYEGAGVRFGYPREWRLEQQSAERVRITDATVQADVLPSVLAEIEPRFVADFNRLVDGIDDATRQRFPNRVVLHDRPVNVAGSTAARLVEHTWRDEGEGGTGAAVHQMDLFALTPDARLAYLAINAAEEHFDAERFRAIIDTFAVTATDDDPERGE